MNIKNTKELDAWMFAHNHHDVVAEKGCPPAGATYEDGTQIIKPVNIAWIDLETSERFEIEYEA